MTFRRRPVLAAEGVGEVAPTEWSEARRGRLAFLGKWNNPIGLVGAAIVSFNVFVAIFGPYIWRIDPDAQDAERLLPPSWAHPFGTDELGRDTLARVIHGAQVSLQVGAISVGIAFVAGLTIGLIAGYYRGVLDGVLMRLVDMMFALPALVLAIVIAGLLGPTRTNAMIAIGIVITPAFARVVRGAVLEVMGYPYIESGRALGASGFRIMLRHLLPNIGAPLIVLVTTYLGTAILERGGAQLPRPRDTAAGGVVGRDAEHRAPVRRPLPVALDLPRRRDHARRARLQLPRRRAARHPRPAPRPGRRRDHQEVACSTS